MQRDPESRSVLLVKLTGIIACAALACTDKKADKASLPPSAPAPAVQAEKESPPVVASPLVSATDEASAPAIANQQETKTPLAGNTESTGPQRLTGAVSSVRRSQIAFRVIGFVESVAVKPGSVVKKGDTLASLDSRDFASRVELAKARRQLAQVGLENARKEFQREEQLKTEHASTATSYDKLMTAFEQAKLSLRLSEIELTTAERDLDQTKLKAPYDCVVATQMKYEGENVQAGNPVFEVYDVSTPEITVAAPERLMGLLVVGGELDVMIPSARFNGKGEIIRLVPVISDKTRTFQVILKLKDEKAKIAPGSYAEAVLN